MLTHFSFFKWQNNPKYDRKKIIFVVDLIILPLYISIIIYIYLEWGSIRNSEVKSMSERCRGLVD